MYINTEKFEISIIIPHWNTDEEIFKSCLNSIKKQIFDLNLIEVIIVDDCSNFNQPKNKIKNSYKKEYPFNIKWIFLNENHGPGYARKIGLNSAKGSYIMFMDADDELLEFDSLSTMYNEINKGYDIVVAKAMEQLEDKTSFQREFNFIWVFAKIFKKSFLKQNDINFNDTRANEDNGFTTLCRMCTSNISYIDKAVYLWKYTKDSITRKDNHEYYFTSIEGYVENMIWVFNECTKRGIDTKDKTIGHFISVWLRMYFYFIEVLSERPIDQANQLLEWSRLFYKNVWVYYDKIVSSKDINSVYSLIVKSEPELFQNHMPLISYPEFVNLVTEETKILTATQILS